MTTIPIKRRLWLATPAFLFLLAAQTALAYDYKSAKDFKTLEHFKDAEAFEASFAGYVQDCLDNTGGGTGGIRCEQIGYELWDRELNIYYGRMLSKLKPKEKEKLQANQRQWIAYRDSAIALNSALLDRRFDTDGTMYQLMRAGDAARIITPMVKQRALMLKDELALASKAPMSKEEDQ